MHRTYKPIDVAHLANGLELALPLHELVGADGGPTVGISAAVHGDEGIGVEVIRRLAADPELEQLRGRLLLLPVANPLAFQGNTRNTPLDMTNMNRVFPGDADGWLTEQIADVITREFLNAVDVHIDLHAGGLYPIVDYVYQMNAPDLSRAFGRPFLYEPPHPYEGTTTQVSGEHARTVVVELGGGLVAQEPYVELALRGLKNVLRAAGALSGAPETPPAQTLLHRIETVRPHEGGLLLPVVDQVGGNVRTGELLGRVVSPFTFAVLEELRAPYDGVMILTHPTLHRIEPGDYGYMVGELATSEALR